MTDRIDLDRAGEVDDVSIATEVGDTFRLERLDHGLVWIALCRANGRREVFEVSTPRNRRLVVTQTETEGRDLPVMG